LKQSIGRSAEDQAYLPWGSHKIRIDTSSGGLVGHARRSKASSYHVRAGLVYSAALSRPEATKVVDIAAGLSVFRIGEDGKLELVHKYVMPSRGSGGGHDSDNEAEKMPLLSTSAAMYCECAAFATRGRNEDGRYSTRGLTSGE
jgi:hypothetical protein